MLLDLLIEATAGVQGSRFARLLRRIDRSMLIAAEADARACPAGDQADLVRRRASEPNGRPPVRLARVSTPA